MPRTLTRVCSETHGFGLCARPPTSVCVHLIANTLANTICGGAVTGAAGWRWTREASETTHPVANVYGMNEPGASSQDIIAAARRAGHRVTRAQLRRWHRFGLLTRPSQRGRGKGAGSTSVYPAGTAERVVAICELLPEHHSLSELAWELWLRGAAIADRLVFDYLRSLMTQHDVVLARVRPLGFERPEVTREALELLSDVAASRSIPRDMRSQLGSDRNLQNQRVETVMRTAVQIMLGTYDGKAAAVIEEEDSDGVMLVRAVGLDAARTDRILDLTPWLAGDPSSDLEVTARLLGGDWLPLLDDLRSSNSVVARSESRAVLPPPLPIDLAPLLHAGQRAWRHERGDNACATT